MSDRAGSTGALRYNQRGSTRGIGKKRSKKSKPKFGAEVKANMTADNSCSPLADLIYCEDLWENVCNWLSGDALCCVANVSKMFNSATRKTPAFVLLAGINNDALIVPWTDETNVLSAKFNPWCSICQNYYCPRHKGCDYDRAMSADRFVEAMLNPWEYSVYMTDQHKYLPRPYVRCGPARPPSPVDCCVASYKPQHADEYECSLNPPVFGVRPGFSYAPFWDVLVGEFENVFDPVMLPRYAGLNDSDLSD